MHHQCLAALSFLSRGCGMCKPSPTPPAIIEQKEQTKVQTQLVCIMEVLLPSLSYHLHAAVPAL